jgi:hypothetical protein
MNNKAPYYSTANDLLKKWQTKNLLSQTTNSSKVKTITNTSKSIVDKKTSIKRKTYDDDSTYSSARRFEIRVVCNEFISYLIPFLVNLNHLMNIKVVIEINHHQLKSAKFFHLLNMSEVKKQRQIHRQQLIQPIIN